MSDAVRIDAATLSDLDEIVPLFDGYRVFYRQSSDLAATRAFLHERLSRGESVIYLARVGARAAGFAQLYPTFGSVSLGTRWILNDLFVDPAHRRHGLGRALTLRAMQHTRDTDAHQLMLLTEHSNTAAQRLYESLGWQLDQMYRRYTWKP